MKHAVFFLVFLSVFVTFCTKRSETIYLSPRPDNGQPLDTNNDGIIDTIVNPVDTTTDPQDPGNYTFNRCEDARTDAEFFAGVDIVEARYNEAKDRIVALSYDEVELLIINPFTGASDRIALNKIGTCFDISRDGTRALVGHDGFVTYVDLDAKSIIQTSSVPAEASDVVLGSNEWGYVFPSSGSHVNVQCIDLNTEVVTASTGHTVSDKQRAEKHPTLDYMYSTDNAVSPIDVEKFDLAAGVADRLYDSPYHGDYPFGGDLWFNEEGDRIFTRAGTILKATESQSTDMTYAGRLYQASWSESILSVSDSKEAERTLVTKYKPDWSSPNGRLPDSVYVVYENQYFAELETTQVPYVKEGDECYRTVCNYAFISSDGTSQFVFGEATSTLNPNKKKWFLLSINIE